MAASPDNYQIGKGIISIRKFTSLPVAWAAETAYSLGDYVYQVSTGNLYVCSTAGTSAASPATGPSGTSTGIADGTAEWDYVAWVDVGNCPKLEFTPEVETLEHFSSRAGVKTRDKKVIISQKGSLALTLEEATMENLEIIMLGTMTGTAPNRTIDVFANTEITCQLKFEATNTIGPQANAFFGNVAFQPSGAVPFISEEWTQYEIVGEVNLDGFSKYGTITES